MQITILYKSMRTYDGRENMVIITVKYNSNSGTVTWRSYPSSSLARAVDYLKEAFPAEKQIEAFLSSL